MTQSDVFMLGGGLDTVSPYLTIPPGYLRAGLNYESGLNGGYRRIAGYEIFDGRPRPHLQTYEAFDVTDASLVAVGSTINGVTSGASGKCVARDTTNNVIGVRVTSGTFEVESITVTDITAVLGTNLGPDALHPDWLLAVQDDYRDDIGAVPGDGRLLGVWRHLSETYAFRNASGGLTADMYKASASGWTQVVMKNQLLFDAGTGTLPTVGQTLTGAGGASAAILAVVTYQGAWGTDAAGYFVLDTVTGAFVDDEVISVSATPVALANGVDAVIELEPDGDYQFVSHNFFAEASTYNVYGCDGVNPGFEFDGTTYVPILHPDLTDPDVPSAPTNNTPHLLAAHKGHLFFAFEDGRIAHSVSGLPRVFSGFLGAAEFGLGAEVNSMDSETGELLVMKTKRKTFGLYGNNIDDWILSVVSMDTGAVRYTSQRLGTVFSVDDRGITNSPRTAAYGNFEAGTVSRFIQPIMDAKKPLATKSTVVRASNQYRIFFSDNSFIMCYSRQDGGFEFTLGEYDITVRTVCNAEDETGTERIFFGSDDGDVYEAEVGTNLNGAVLESWILLPFSHAQMTRVRKRYRRVTFDMEAEGTVALTLSSELHSGDPETLFPLATSADTFGGEGGYFDLDDWDDVFFDSQSISGLRHELTGTGLNLSMAIYNTSATTPRFSIHSAQIDFDPRRQER